MSQIKAAVCHSFDEPLRIETVDLRAPNGSEVEVSLGAVAVCHLVETCPLPGAYKWGCMDTEACNYDSDATDDDGSCLYGSACDD